MIDFLINVWVINGCILGCLVFFVNIAVAFKVVVSVFKSLGE